MLPSPLETLGEDSIVHDVPLRFSTNVVTGFEPSSEPPTAMQFLAEVQDTPERLLPCAPEGFGVVSMDQAVPLNTSASVTWVPGLFCTPLLRCKRWTRCTTRRTRRFRERQGFWGASQSTTCCRSTPRPVPAG